MKLAAVLFLLLIETVALAAGPYASNKWGISPNLNNQSVLNISSVAPQTATYAANANRSYLMIQNQSAASTLTVKFGKSIVSTEGIQIQGGSTYSPGSAPINSIYMKSSSGVIPVIILEGIE